jgi:hypothetical protein
MKDTNYFFDENDNIFRKCYKDCLHCDILGDVNDMKCLDCESPKYIAEPNNCIEDITNYYYSEEKKKYIKCYKSCYGCDKNSNEKNHNCKKCNDKYHFIYNEKGKCISEEEKPSDTYLDKFTNTYMKCYERCLTCDREGNIIDNNCKECLKDKDNYTYHFIYNEKGKCINEEEKPSDTYLDIETNTFKQCNKRCQTCENFNECTECSKDENNNYIFHFIENEKGKCISESELETPSYLDENDNTYKSCPEGTVRVEKNKCVKDISLLFIIIIVIIIIILLLLIICLVRKIKSRKKNQFDKIVNETNEMTELIK